MIKPTSVVGLANTALGAAELVAGGGALFQWRADIFEFVLLTCLGAPMQIQNSSLADHAVNLGQLRGVTNSRCGSVYYSGTPTSGTATTFTRALSFMAPSNGNVLAVQFVNVSEFQPGTQANTVTVAGSAPGSLTSQDITSYPMTNSVAKFVSAGGNRNDHRGGRKQ